MKKKKHSIDHYLEHLDDRLTRISSTLRIVDYVHVPDGIKLSIVKIPKRGTEYNISVTILSLGNEEYSVEIDVKPRTPTTSTLNTINIKHVISATIGPYKLREKFGKTRMASIFGCNHVLEDHILFLIRNKLNLGFAGIVRKMKSYSQLTYYLSGLSFKTRVDITPAVVILTENVILMINQPEVAIQWYCTQNELMEAINEYKWKYVSKNMLGYFVEFLEDKGLDKTYLESVIRTGVDTVDHRHPLK